MIVQIVYWWWRILLFAVMMFFPPLLYDIASEYLLPVAKIAANTTPEFVGLPQGVGLVFIVLTIGDIVGLVFFFIDSVKNHP
jgi:hypothetical protein